MPEYLPNKQEITMSRTRLTFIKNNKYILRDIINIVKWMKRLRRRILVDSLKGIFLY